MWYFKNFFEKRSEWSKSDKIITSVIKNWTFFEDISQKGPRKSRKMHSNV